MSSVQSFIKQPSEVLKKALSFAGSATIVELVDVAAVKRGLVAGSADLTVAGELVGGMIFVTLIGGTDGERYLITGKGETGEGEQLEAELEVAVIDGAWTMPDGGDGYLSIAEFVATIGLDEAVRLTDLAGDGRIDRAYLVSALAAVQTIADAWIGARYAVPLATPPAVVKTAIADLVRARLYTRGAPDAIDAAGKAAQKLLEQIGAGRLPLPGIEAPEAAASIAPVVVSLGTRRYPDGLAGY